MSASAVVRIVLLSLALVWPTASLANFKFNPQSAEIGPGRFEQVFTFTNEGQNLSELAFSIKPWGDGHDARTENALIATPPVVRLRPGETQVVRLMARGRNLPTPLFYRLNAMSRPITDDGRTLETASQVPLNISFPIAFVDPGARYNLVPIAPGVIQNAGNHYAKVEGVADASGRVYRLLAYILPGETFRLPRTLNGGRVNLQGDLRLILDGRKVFGPVR